MRRVLDASAVLASLKSERGADIVDAHIDSAFISAVNLSEVAASLLRTRNDPADVREILRTVAAAVVPADEEMGIEAGLMRRITDPFGLSLADRFCLTLGKRLDAVVLTADREWRNVANAVGVRVELIR